MNDSYISYWLIFLLFVILAAKYIANNEKYEPVVCTAGGNGGRCKDNTGPYPAIDGIPGWSRGDEECASCPKKGFPQSTVAGV